MKNTVIFDTTGVPDIMVEFTPDELGFPGELRGRKVEVYLIGKYLATMINGVPHSLPFQRPAVNVSHDDAIRLCEAKGPGWHLLTNDEWAALARQIYKNGTLPRGNTDSGKSHSCPEETGTPCGDGMTLTGSGPVTWNHDLTAEGVADMCGNVWEHVGGLRFLDGQVQVIPGNRAAAGVDQSSDSKEWTPIYTDDGDPIYFAIDDEKIALQTEEPEEKNWGSLPFRKLTAGAVKVPEKMIELGLFPSEGYEGSDYFWLDTDGERCVYRGGYWYSGAGAGVFALSGGGARSGVNVDLGFRPAYVRYSGESGDLENLDRPGDWKKEEPKEALTLSGMIRRALAIATSSTFELSGCDVGFDRSQVQQAAMEATTAELAEAARLLSDMSTAASTVRVAQLIVSRAQKNLEALQTSEEGVSHE